MVALPDADQTPEQIVGLADGVAPGSQFARRLAENGMVVLVPTLLNRSNFVDNESEREWIYRQAYHMGRHVIGYEVQKVLAGLDWFRGQYGSGLKLGVAGYAEGGLVALLRRGGGPAGGGDAGERVLRLPPADRRGADLSHGLGVVAEFGDAEIATLIAPRGLVVEHSAVPEVHGQKGDWTTPKYESVQSEFQRISTLLPANFQPRELIAGPEHAPVAFGSDAALAAFARMLGGDGAWSPSGEIPRDGRRRLDVAARQRQQVRGMEDLVQGLVTTSLTRRNAFYLYKILPGPGAVPADRRKAMLETFTTKSQWYRQYLWEEVFGKVEDPCLPLNPRWRKYHEDPKWTAYDVVLDVWPEVFAWGLYLVPKDIAPGEKRPVVVVQPGLECLPKDAIDRPQPGTWGVAARLADRGFVVFVPQNLYRGGDDFRTHRQGSAQREVVDVVVDDRPARTHSRMAERAGLCRCQTHRLLRLQLRRNHRGLSGPDCGEVLPVDLLGQLQ